jgi:hypothetical protein
VSDTCVNARAGCNRVEVHYHLVGSDGIPTTYLEDEVCLRFVNLIERDRNRFERMTRAEAERDAALREAETEREQSRAMAAKLLVELDRQKDRAEFLLGLADLQRHDAGSARG